MWIASAKSIQSVWPGGVTKIVRIDTSVFLDFDPVGPDGPESRDDEEGVSREIGKIAAKQSVSPRIVRSIGQQRTI